MLKLLDGKQKSTGAEEQKKRREGGRGQSCIWGHTLHRGHYQYGAYFEGHAEPLMSNCRKKANEC
jgi:hypothetical protein